MGFRPWVWGLGLEGFGVRGLGFGVWHLGFGLKVSNPHDFSYPLKKMMFWGIAA